MSTRKPASMSDFQQSAIVATPSPGHRRPVTKVTQARAKAQRAKIDQEAQQRHQGASGLVRKDRL